MFNFSSWFKKESNLKIPTIHATQEHKTDDKKQHTQFLLELEDGLKESSIFQLKYIKEYLTLYKKYESFTGKDNRLIEQSSNFSESLTELAKTYKKNEIKKYVRNIIGIANRRSYTKVQLERYVLDDMTKKVQLTFPQNDLLCGHLILEKKKYHNKIIPINKAPIFPLNTCFKCQACHLGISYRPYFGEF